jgi:hypothetical protein
MRGTAFTIGGGMYITAGHVWQNACRFPLQAIGLHPTGKDDSEGMLLWKIVDAEVFDTIDLAVVKVDAPFGQTFAWSAERAALLDQVRACGYPFAFDPEAEMLTVRGFQGEIVGGRVLKHLPGGSQRVTNYRSRVRADSLGRRSTDRD